MAIPGVKPDLPVKAKVRVGEKKKSAKGVEYPSSADHFICDDDDFRRVVGEGKKSITIFLPFARPEDCFSSGLEWWRGKQLTCYSKGEGNPPLAYRVPDQVRDAEVRGDPLNSGRVPITCPVRDCPILKSKDGCKPMGRLQFWIDGIDRRLGVYQLDTKSWNTIEKIEAALSVLDDPRGVPLRLSVEMVAKGTSKYPVISLEAVVEVKDDMDAVLADALLQLRKRVDVSAPPEELRVTFAHALDYANPGWRERPVIVDRIKEIGVHEAAKGLLARYEL